MNFTLPPVVSELSTINTNYYWLFLLLLVVFVPFVGSFIIGWVWFLLKCVVRTVVWPIRWCIGWWLLGWD